MSRLAAFYTSLVTLRVGLDHPSSANGTGTVLPRKQSQQVHLGRYRVFFSLGLPQKKPKSKIVLEYPDWASPGPPKIVKVYGLGLP